MVMKSWTQHRPTDITTRSHKPYNKIKEMTEEQLIEAFHTVTARPKPVAKYISELCPLCHQSLMRRLVHMEVS
jgi:hypothetical protein